MLMAQRPGYIIVLLVSQGYSPAAEGANLAREYPQWVFADYASQDLPHQESEWCQAGIIERF